MVQIIPHSPGIGEMFGAGLTKGIGQGLEAYYKTRQKNQQRQQKQSQLKDFLEQNKDNLSPEQAGIIEAVGNDLIPESIGKGLLAELSMRSKPSAFQESMGQTAPADAQTGQPATSTVPTQEDVQRVGAWDPNRARLLQEERKIGSKQAIANRGDILKAQTEAQESLTKERDVIQALDTQLAAVRAGDVGIWSKANLSEWLRNAGFETLANAAQSEGGAAFKSSGKQIFTGAKDIFGARVTNLDTQIFQQMMAEIGRNEKANELVIKSMMVPRLAAQEKSRFRLDMINQNPNIDAVTLNNLTYTHMQRFDEDLYKDWQDTLYGALDLSPNKPKATEQKKRKSLDEIFGSAQ